MAVFKGRLLALILIVAAMTPARAVSAIVYEFNNGGILDDGTKTHLARFPADDETGIIGTITTVQVLPYEGTLNAALNERSGLLAINSEGGGDAPGEFDGQESWTFSWDVATTLDFIDFDAFRGSETMTIQSDGWLDREYEIKSGSNVKFARSSGLFTFGDDGVDAFDLENIVSGDSLLVPANTHYTIANGIGSAAISQLIFSAPVTANATAAPEPGSAVALLGLAGAVAAKRWRRKRKLVAISSEE